MPCKAATLLSAIFALLLFLIPGSAAFADEGVAGAYGSNSLDQTTTSLKFIQGMGINANFGQIMLFSAAHMQTYRNIVCVLGPTDAQHLVEQELFPVIAKYQPQWDKNLATAWNQLLSEEEMRSLLELKRQSPYASKYQAAGIQAGQAMKASSEDLLKGALGEAMISAWNKVSAEYSKNPATTCKSESRAMK
jgi:hypothetical protein